MPCLQIIRPGSPGFEFTNRISMPQYIMVLDVDQHALPKGCIDLL